MAAKAKVLKLITETSALTKEAGLLAKQIRGVDNRVQVYLLSEIKHIEEHRNPTRLNSFFDAVHKSGARTHAMHAFIQAHANVEYDEDNAKYVMCPARSKDDAKAAFDAACLKMWTEYKPEGKVVQFNLETRVEKLLVDAFKNGVEVDEIKSAIARMEADAKLKADEVLKKAAKQEA